MAVAILLIEDDLAFAARLCGFLRKEKHDTEHAPSGEEGVRLFGEQGFDLVLLDLVLPGIDGMETLKKLKELDPAAAVIVMTAHASISTAVEAMRLGALDFVTKPLDLDALVLKLEQARQLIGLRSDFDYLFASERQNGDLERLVGNCMPMRAVKERICEVAKTDNTTVLVTGPSGTGKELVTRAIHSLSTRGKKPLMQIDCTALPLTLMESELFGHERGAFSGADRTKKGLLELADGGTLLLDEIGDMAIELQAKLLRVLQERQFRRVGGTRDLAFDVRVIAATNQDLDAMCDRERFRRDLLYRLKVFEVQLPPLVERGDDILELANAFLQDFAGQFRKSARGFDVEAQKALMAHSFPGNVRELRNIVEQAMILAKGELITRGLLSIRDTPDEQPASSPHSSARGCSLADLGETPLVTVERLLIKEAMQKSKGNKKHAAELLGISRFSLQRKLEKLIVEGLGVDEG